METCARCKIRQTELYEHNVPICVTCAAIQEAKQRTEGIHRILLGALRNASEAQSANRDFNDVLEKPTGLPHPDGSSQIANASQKVAVARKELMRAHNRLNHFLARGIVPDDLK
jgi:hypothetical protein